MKLRRLTIISVGLLCAGCERGVHEMYDQAKYKPLTPTPLFADGNSSRPQVPGTVPYPSEAVQAEHTVGVGDSPAADGAVRTDPAGVRSNPLPITPAVLARGRDRFEIYCAPCHSRAGDGDGMIVRRGFPRPPSYHTDRLRNAPDSHFYQVISDGYGLMYPYADRIDPEDRWAIVAYIRALQLSQHAPAALMGTQDRARLQEPPR